MKKLIILTGVVSSLMLVAFFPNEGPNKKSQSTKFTEGKSLMVYTTANNTNLRLSAVDTISFTSLNQPLETEPSVFIDPTKTFQTVVGIGGAITDASAETFAKLPLEKQKEFLEAYYDTNKGIGYSLARTNIQSCDFSSDMYDYVALNDTSLKSFSLSHDEKFKMPLIKQAIKHANNKLTLYASPWSPPAWMKDNNNKLKGGKLKPACKQAWANMFVRFINEYEKAGIPVWGFTVQNEPMAVQTWESCIYTADEEREFIKKYLGPTLKKNGLAERKLIAWDHNRDLIYHRAAGILNDPEAAKYVWGIGYHWYETWTGGSMQFDNVRRVKEAFPDKNLIFTEGCVEKFNFDQINEWRLGERYGTSLVNDFNCGTVAWTDWNILLDEKGGPNHVGNFCFAPVIADTRNGKLHYTNSYYYIGHFSKFIKPGAKRIVSSSSRMDLQTTAFINPDGKIVVIVLNTSENNYKYHLSLEGKTADLESLPHSISTLIF
jgi:glucosylceramidase